MLIAESVQRLIAVTVVVAVEEASSLIAIRGIIGGINIQPDLLNTAGDNSGLCLYNNLRFNLAE